MASLIPGYEYDIFISYRQKDNKGNGWVSEFVDALKTELESTFKEEISVYFDINPHDGLLETHDVDASLKEKLKCLVFIPIISRTYCDPKSFAWEHEFKSFVEHASKDQFGLKVKLPSGNVASRVLPVRIHDLDIADIKECESVLGGVLRGVEFIYKEPGVNKPLAADDDEKKNSNNTKYRIQVNKVANAIKEILSGLKTEPVFFDEETADLKEKSEESKKEEKKQGYKTTERLQKRKLLFGGIILTMLLVLAALLAYPKIFKRDTLEKLRSSGERISVAVMPFKNMTNDTIWDVWQDGIQDILITFLSNSEELRVRDPESVKSIIQSEGLLNYSSITPDDARAISQKLDANIFIYGNIKRAGNILRLYAQLIDSKSAEVFKSFQIEDTNNEENIFQLVDSLSSKIRDFLIVHELQRGHSHESQTIVSTYSPDAYRYFMLGENLFSDRDYTSAIKLFSQALAVDSSLFVAILYTAASFGNMGLLEQGKEWCLRAYQKRDFMPIRLKLYSEWLYANYFETPYEEIINLEKIIEVDDQAPMAYYILGLVYHSLNQYEKAIPQYVKALDIRKRWGMNASSIYNYTALGEAYHKTGQYREEKKLYKKARLEFPDDPILLYSEIVLALSEGKISDANNIIEKFKAIQKDNSVSEVRIITNLADIYSEAGLFDKAEGFYREALLLEPESPSILNDLAWVLIDNDINIIEGIGLIEKAIEINPGNYKYLDTKGWGLYKQGKYIEAVDLLQKAWTSKPVYDHDVYLHLEAAKKAVAGQKNN